MKSLSYWAGPRLHTASHHWRAFCATWVWTEREHRVPLWPKRKVEWRQDRSVWVSPYRAPHNLRNSQPCHSLPAPLSLPTPVHVFLTNIIKYILHFSHCIPLISFFNNLPYPFLSPWLCHRYRLTS
jgi:hypothetical protein